MSNSSVLAHVSENEPLKQLAKVMFNPLVEYTLPEG